MGEMEKPEHIRMLESWMRSYRPEELFDEHGGLRPLVRDATPEGMRRMSANPHANGGILLRDLRMPDFQRLRHRCAGAPALSSPRARACRAS